MTDNVKVDLYTDIKAALLEIEDSNKEQVIKHVLKYNSQDANNLQDDISRNHPICYIEFSSISWLPSMLRGNQTDTTQQQKGTIEVTIHIDQFALSEDNDTFIDHMDLVNKVYRKLTMLYSDDGIYGPLQRVSEVDDINNENIRRWQTTFTTQVTECGISEELVDSAPVSLTINKTIV